MYLNLDLLYNIDKYLYPLFYYKIIHWGHLVYSPMIKKSVYKNNHIIYSDYITKKYNEYKEVSLVSTFDDTGYIFTENTINFDGRFTFIKYKPFKINKTDLIFLKSNTRIN